MVLPPQGVCNLISFAFLFSNLKITVSCETGLCTQLLTAVERPVSSDKNWTVNTDSL